MAHRGAVTVLALAACLIAPIWAADVDGEDMETCGEASYFPSEYNCYNNSTLCPIIYNLPTLPCGNDTGGCYASEMFSCEDGEVKTLPEATEPFTMVAHGTRETYKNLTVKACANYLAVGANARECTSCSGGAGVDCGSYHNDTVLLPNGEMVSSPSYLRSISRDQLLSLLSWVVWLRQEYYVLTRQI